MDVSADDFFISAKVFRTQSSEHQTERSASTSVTACMITADINLSCASSHGECAITSIIQDLLTLSKFKMYNLASKLSRGEMVFKDANKVVGRSFSCSF